MAYEFTQLLRIDFLEIWDEVQFVLKDRHWWMIEDYWADSYGECWCCG